MPFYYHYNSSSPWEDWHFFPTVMFEANNLTKIPDVEKLVFKRKMTLPGIVHVQFNKESGHTTIVWDDDTSTTVSCVEGAEFEEYVGFCAAVAKKLFGSTSAVKKLIEAKDVDAVRKAKTKARDERIQAQREFEQRNHERAVRKAAKQKLFEAEVNEMVERMKKEREEHDKQ